MDREQQKFKRAIDTLKSGDKAGAWKLFAEILRENPSHAEAWVGLSLSTSRQNRRREYLQRALRLDPNHAYARSALARLKNFPVQGAKNPKIQRKWLSAYAGIGAAFLILCLVLTGLGYFVNQQTQASRMASLPVEVPAHHYVFIDFYADW